MTSIASRPVPELQSIRGIAAMVVLLGHCLSYFPVGGFAARPMLFNGTGSVIVFFVLSGAVLTRSLMSRPLTIGAAASFWIRRAFRIYPAVWVASAAAMLYLAGPHRLVDPADVSDWYRQFFAPERLDPFHVGLSFAGLTNALIPPLWTVLVEIAGSALLPFAVLLISAGRPVFAAVTVVAVVAGLVFGPDSHYELLLYLPFFLLGAWIAIAPEPMRAVVAGSRGRAAAVLAVATLTLLVLRPSAAAWGIDLVAHERLLAAVEALAATAAVAAVSWRPDAAPLLAARPVVWLGDVSYGLYLVHFTVMGVVSLAIARWMPGLAADGRSVLLAVATAVVTLPVAWAIHRAIERPGIAAGREAGSRVARILDRRRSTA